ncbi:hypothetical protein EV198_1229 [Roseivirga ehrenbergii]|uniref:Uncharacterized protein n=4 Tax=Roseivirga TaxID=290180 RepID=A0A0L8ALG2_9BACT|nr:MULTISPECIES: hypothetical protein [Roseivirga]KOF03318.1 hypothetical protein OB69_08510 [Roseivirga seohaensis subsp. aquiponti]KYG77106.1 hypothetical protein MB14_02590 [Roseivirga ehrenbergii]KYG79825.1 hypothetical protein AWW67_10965 [Roseivirga seohaensis]TCL14387.1 hypothetical protein EV198_1229 [Roseivirga ehrenbergii]
MFSQSTLYFGTMDGHHKISISGVVFYVENECKNLLLNHLKFMHRNNTLQSENQFESGEERVAEILLEELKGGKDVVTCKELEAVINRTRNLR